MSTDRYTKIVLTAIALALTAIACRPLIRPSPALAGVSASDLYIEPGVYSLRSPDGTRSQLGKVVVDLRTGKIWGYPTGTSAPYPLFAGSSEPPTSKPYLLGKFDLDAMEKEH
ncbi:MAG TPA: hypothetical protein VHZ28_14875 [Terracidiphilus sp.]|jgi:hypothetical protein|nr:hypothetical protein [Terracidiphilus sp.]